MKMCDCSLGQVFWKWWYERKSGHTGPEKAGECGGMPLLKYEYSPYDSRWPDSSAMNLVCIYLVARGMRIWPAGGS